MTAATKAGTGGGDVTGRGAGLATPAPGVESLAAVGVFRDLGAVAVDDGREWPTEPAEVLAPWGAEPLPGDSALATPPPARRAAPTPSPTASPLSQVARDIRLMLGSVDRLADGNR
ncbi:hypothetical protein [Mycobacterium sp. SA01]|uniref:hypothetical protein n=1 Tax=Mycobacterium sp. SA01 TaxID=3238820 RepID=UPI00351B4374